MVIAYVGLCISSINIRLPAGKMGTHLTLIDPLFVHGAVQAAIQHILARTKRLVGVLLCIRETTAQMVMIASSRMTDPT